MRSSFVVWGISIIAALKCFFLLLLLFLLALEEKSNYFSVAVLLFRVIIVSIYRTNEERNEDVCYLFLSLSLSLLCLSDDSLVVSLFDCSQLLPPTWKFSPLKVKLSIRCQLFSLCQLSVPLWSPNDYKFLSLIDKLVCVFSFSEFVSGQSDLNEKMRRANLINNNNNKKKKKKKKSECESNAIGTSVVIVVVIVVVVVKQNKNQFSVLKTIQMMIYE